MRAFRSIKFLIACILVALVVTGAWCTTKSPFGIGKVPASALVAMVRPRDLYTIVDMIRNVEDRFNHKYHYDWVLISEEDFTDKFKQICMPFASGKIDFRTVNRKKDWRQPSTLDRNLMQNEMQELARNGVPDGGSTSFRIKSNFMFRSFFEYLPEYRYYALIDPQTKFYCDMDDFFSEMVQNQYKIGFTLSMGEPPHSTDTLSNTVNTFIKHNKGAIHSNQWVDSFVEPWAKFCSFSPGFEVGDLDFFRSEKYHRWISFIDGTGGVFYHRWSDYALRTLGAALFLDLKEVKYFGDVGMYFGGKINCPTTLDARLDRKCTCPTDPLLPKNERVNIFTYRENSCTPKLLSLQGEPFQSGWDMFSDASVHNEYKSALG